VTPYAAAPWQRRRSAAGVAPTAPPVALPCPPPWYRTRGPRAAAAPLPADFWVALLDFLNADPALAGAFPGGFLQGPAAPKQPVPYCRVDQAEAGALVTAEDYSYRPRFRVVAASDDSAKALADLLTREVLASPARDPIAYQGPADPEPWVEAGVRLVPPAPPPAFAGYRDGGAPVWRVDRSFLVNVVS